MKLGCLSSLWRGVATAPVDVAIECLNSLGIPCIEITAEGTGRSRHLGADFTLREAEDIAERCRDAGLSISSVSAHVPLTCPDEAMRDKSLAEYRAAIDQAAAMGVDIVHGYSGGLYNGIQSDAEEEEVWKVFEETLNKVLDYASGKGVRFGIEPVISLLVHDLPSTQRMFDTVPRDDLWLNFDPCHFLRSGGMDEVTRAIGKFGDRIIHVHAHDSVGSGKFNWNEFRKNPVFNWRPDFRPVFLGEVDWRAVTEHLRAAGYDGVLSYEYPVGYEERYEYYLRAALTLFTDRMRPLLEPVQ